jgi:hypothetical protein
MAQRSAIRPIEDLKFIMFVPLRLRVLGLARTVVQVYDAGAPSEIRRCDPLGSVRSRLVSGWLLHIVFLVK